MRSRHSAVTEVRRSSQHHSLQAKLMKMALNTVFIAMLCFLASSDAQQHCNKVQCRVLPVGEDAKTHFRSRATDERVRLIYLNLKIGNDSYHPLQLQDEFLPARWVWAKSISEPMLSLPFDYDVLSLGLLNFQVRSVTVELEDQPSGCLASLNSSCQNMAVGRALLYNVTLDINTDASSDGTEVVCVAMIVTVEDVEVGPSSFIEYRCCRRNASLADCDLPLSIEAAVGRVFFHADFLKMLPLLVLVFYWPAIFLAIPDSIFSLRYECEKEDRMEDEETNNSLVESSKNQTRDGYERILDGNEEDGRMPKNEQIPVEDSSPISFLSFLRGCVQSLPDIRVSFNIKLAALQCCILPFGFYVHQTIYFTLKQDYIQESLAKSPHGATLTGFSEPPDFIDLNGYIFVTFVSLWALPCIISVFFLKPKDFLKQLSVTCYLCDASAWVSEFHGGSRKNLRIHFVGDEMFHHLKLLQEWLCLWMTFSLRPQGNGLKILQKSFSCPLKNHWATRKRRALYVSWGLFSILAGAVLAVVLVCVYLCVSLALLIVCSPVVTLILTFARLIGSTLRNFRYIYLLLASFLYVFIPVAGVVFFLSPCSFIISILEFTVTGLVLNADILTPYAAFSVVVVTNIYLCYANLQNRYKELKRFILKYWQMESPTTNTDPDTIPTDLFWFVCDKVSPIETGICVMFRNMALIVSLLFMALSSIVLFGNTYKISTLVSTVAVFLSGAIPGLFFKCLTKGTHFNGWTKIKVKREIETAVKQFNSERLVERARGSDFC